jgi:hypothetical protein
MREGYNAADAARLASWATMLLATGTICGCAMMPTIANRLGRRGALACYFSMMAVSIAVGFRSRVLLTPRRLVRFYSLPVFRGSRWREFQCLYRLAAGTIPHGMPRERVCVRHERRTICGSRRHVSGRRRHFPTTAASACP